jgi:hypothetical protein
MSRLTDACLATPSAKNWDSARAEAALKGVLLVRSDDRDGEVLYFAIRGGELLRFRQLDELEAVLVGGAH